MTKWYDGKNILKHAGPYYFIIGERSNGKTYFALREALLDYINNGHRSVYVRRWDTDLKGARAKRVALQIAEVMKNEKVKKYTGCMFYQGSWYLTTDRVIKHKDGSEEHIPKKEDMPFMFSMAMNNMEHDKGGNMNTSISSINTIIFDEIVTRQRYLPDEASMFFDTISTIKRRKTGIRVFLLANTVSKFCPYFKLFGIEFTPKMKAGEIRENDKGNVVVERTEDNVDHSVKDPYFDFDNKTVGMITHGKWEIAEYPKITTKWSRKDVMQDVFLIYDGHYLHGEVVSVDGNPFLFWYPLKGKIHDENTEMIYSDKPDYRRNWYQSITRPVDDVSKFIAHLFSIGKVFYSDNDTGEILRNYIIQNVISVEAKYRSM